MTRNQARAICAATAVRVYDARTGGDVHDLYVDRALEMLGTSYTYTKRHAALTEARRIDTHDYYADVAAILRAHDNGTIQRSYAPATLDAALRDLLTATK